MVHLLHSDQKLQDHDYTKYGGEKDLWIVKSESCSQTEMRSSASD